MTIIGICERCERDPKVALEYDSATDEMICIHCAEEIAEIRWEQHQQDLMENGPGPSLQDQCIEARKLK